MTRSRPLRRGAAPKRTGRIKPKKRSASEFARIYGSRKRVEFVKSMPCTARLSSDGCAGVIENAHIETGGMGRKAGADKIVPLCSKHHRQFDEHSGIFAGRSVRHDMQWIAEQVEKAWLAHQHQEPKSNA